MLLLAHNLLLLYYCPTYLLVNLVERDPSPNGFQLVNPEESGKVNQRDLVELATEINKVQY